MRTIHSDAVVVGGGAAGMAAAIAIANNGHTVNIIERESVPGGILNQCIHNGFGIHYFDEELTGPEYSERFIERLGNYDAIGLHIDTTVVDIRSDETMRRVYAFCPSDGLLEYQTKAVVLSLGCRERNRGNIGIPGTRPAGVYTAGLAQRLVNIEGYVPGRQVVIVGSGDIGLIMARRMRWVGAEVLGVVEIQQYPSGITRNIVQCLNDFDIPLYLSHVISRIFGHDRVEGVEISPIIDGHAVDAQRFTVDCDTLLLSVGLIPDNEIIKKAGIAINPETNGPHVDASYMTSVEGIFACGNGLHVHDLVDYASEEAEYCGKAVSRFVRDEAPGEQLTLVPGTNLRYLVPERLRPGQECVLFARSMIVKNDARLVVTCGETELMSKRLRHVQPSEMIRFVLTTDAEVRGEVEVSLR